MNDLGQYRMTEKAHGPIPGVERRLFPAVQECFFCRKPAFEGHPLIPTNFGLGHVIPFPAHKACADDFAQQMAEDSL